MSKHTPGPWTINKKKAHPWIVECETNVPGVKGEVATVGYLPYARLIAAAPELLEACEDALRDLLIAQQRMGMETNTVKKLRQAISKAEGK